MDFKKLGEIADILISNVDKKTKENEYPVKLCNFVDVYYNWAISSYHYQNLMNATATKQEIDKFSIREGDVAITKDSETRDDIGVSTYISESLENTLLGYHCVLIRPNKNVILGKYLNIVLHSSYAQKYFEANAGGSGQRYTLKDTIIKDMLIPIPSIEEQEQLGNLANSIDKKIENNNKINAELESLAKTIYDYWFLQFEFPNEEGKPYKSSGGKMVWNEKLKREIPEGWNYVLLQEFEKNIITGKTPSTKNKDNFGGNIPFITIGDIRNNTFITKTEITLSEQGSKSQENKYIPEGSICVTCIATTGLVGITTKKSQTNQQINSIICQNSFNRFYLLYAIRDFFKFSSGAKSGNTFANMSKRDFENIQLRQPEESILKQFEKKIAPILMSVKNNSVESEKLSSLRDFLLPMLMNGQVQFK